MLVAGDRSDASEELKPSYRIIEAVATHEGIDPTDVEPPEYQALYDVCNPEALDALFENRHDGQPRGTGQVTLSFCGYTVELTSDGEVTVSEPDE